MSIEDDFKDAAERITKLPKRPPNDVLLQLYAFFKQGTLGDVVGTRPGLADFEGRAKFDAWKKLLGKTNEEAMHGYMSLVQQLESKSSG